LIQGNTKSEAVPEEWAQFFAMARESGFFKGGSAIGSDRTIVGDVSTAKPTDHIAGFMRFDSDDKEKVLELLKIHPVVLHGGSVELCEMPMT
ncbi:MAG TPA: hypothetical protein VK970_00900, partial [Candidatus Methylacidiphilales bacterium]|nr:hypothetical protein [Candidatus Methylacidiphilales bacterium]